MRLLPCLPLLLATVLLAAPSGAAPILPAGDDEVVQTLPASGGRRGEERQLRRQLAQNPGDAELAVRLARGYLERAREQGDPRFVGLATAALKHWSDANTAPPAVLLLQATLLQYTHDFDGAAGMLERLLRRQPRDPQAWLTLATVRRVQGRYDASDAACRGLANAGAGLHASACQAENDALRGRVDAARTTLRRLLGSAGKDDAVRGWLLTTLAELEERAGNTVAADTHWRAALRADPSLYTALGYADFLIAARRPADALAQLAALPRSDAVVLRQAIAAAREGVGAAAAREMRERIELANERPGTQGLHGREQAMFALWVEQQPQRALELAQRNAERQREPIDLLLLAQAARAANQPKALREADELRRSVGLVDRRFDALL